MIPMCRPCFTGDTTMTLIFPLKFNGPLIMSPLMAIIHELWPLSFFLYLLMPINQLKSICNVHQF